MKKKDFFKKGLQLMIFYIWYKGVLDPRIINGFLRSAYHTYVSPQLLYESPEEGIQKACHTILNTLHMEIIIEKYQQRGQNGKPLLFVCNHHSYLDLIVLKKILPKTHVIVKQETSQQEVFFAFVGMIDYVFENWNIIPYSQGDRESGAKVKQQMAKCWSQGLDVLVFPEGGVKKNMKTPFFPGSFRLAVSKGIDIQPITLYYNHSICCADDGEEPFQFDVVENLKYLANRSDNRCYLYFHPRIDGSQWTNADFLKSHCEEMMLAKWKEYVARDDRHELESNEILTV